MSAADERTVVVELTPQGRGAVAVVLVDGPGAREAVRQCFVPVTPWKDGDPAIDRIVFGRWGSGSGEELVVCRRGTERFEIHCHGGIAAVRAVMVRLAAAGGPPISWQDWLRMSDSEPIPAASGRRNSSARHAHSSSSATTRALWSTTERR